MPSVHPRVHGEVPSADLSCCLDMFIFVSFRHSIIMSNLWWRAVQMIRPPNLSLTLLAEVKGYYIKPTSPWMQIIWAHLETAFSNLAFSFHRNLFLAGRDSKQQHCCCYELCNSLYSKETWQLLSGDAVKAIQDSLFSFNSRTEYLLYLLLLILYFEDVWMFAFRFALRITDSEERRWNVGAAF